MPDAAAKLLRELLNNPDASDLTKKSDPVLEPDPTQQIRNYLTAQRLMRLQQQPNAQPTPAVQDPTVLLMTILHHLMGRLSPYTRDVEQFRTTPSSPLETDRMPLGIRQRLLTKV